MSSRDPVLEAFRLIEFAVKNYPDATFVGQPRIVKVKRPSPIRRTPTATAHITIEVPDSAAAKFKGLNGSRDTLMMAHIQKDVVERFMSPIITPGEVDA